MEPEAIVELSEERRRPRDSKDESGGIQRIAALFCNRVNRKS
jgi:hypothetical protein